MRVRVCMRVHIDETSQYESSNEEHAAIYNLSGIISCHGIVCARRGTDPVVQFSFAPVPRASACDTACLRRHSMRRSTVKPKKKNGKEKEKEEKKDNGDAGAQDKRRCGGWLKDQATAFIQPRISSRSTRIHI